MAWGNELIEIILPSTKLEADESVADPPGILLSALRRRTVPLALLAATVVTTMAYTLAWGPMFGHSYWVVPGDVWGTLHTSQFVAWGDLGDVYSSGGGLVSLPGICVVLAPVAFLVSHLGLSVSFPFGLAHPSAWLLLGPAEAALGGLVLLPLDQLAERLGLDHRSRVAAAVCEAVLLWPVLAIWGHPEDPLAVAFAVWALLAAMDGRWRPACWLFGLAVVMQPLVVLMLPLVVAMAPRNEWIRLGLRSAAPSAVLIAIPLAQSWHQTTTALFKQPNYPAIDHPTPWLALAPVLTRAHLVAVHRFAQVTGPGGTTRFAVSVVHTMAGETVAAGPGRLIAIGLACLIGVLVHRRRPAEPELVWLCCVALALRCVFESVMDPYYLWPPLALAFVLVARSTGRLVGAAACGAALTVWSYWHLGPWEWWPPLVVLLAAIVLLARPGASVSERRSAEPRVLSGVAAE